MALLTGTDTGQVLSASGFNSSQQPRQVGAVSHCHLRRHCHGVAELHPLWVSDSGPHVCRGTAHSILGRCRGQP